MHKYQAYTREQAIAAFWSKVRVGEPDECWPWQGYIWKLGYGCVQWEGKTTGAHRVAFFLSGGYLPEGKQQVCHTCDNRRCCNPGHLFAGSQKDNISDAARKDRLYKGPKHWAKGERHGQAKLTVVDVRSIREERTKGASFRAIAQRHQISASQVHRIIKGKAWTK
jgi:hypothetical protein